MFQRLGVRWHLLIAFFGISGFALIAAAAGLYSFSEVGKVIGRITDVRVPSAIASLELSRQAERILTAAPALLAVSDAARHEEVSRGVLAEAEELSKLLDALRRSAVNVAALGSIEPAVAGLGRNLGALDALIATRLEVRERKSRLLRRVSDTTVATQRLFAPAIAVMESKVAEWQRTRAAPDLDAAGRASMTEIAEEMASFLPQQKVQAEVSAISDTLNKAAAAESAANLPHLAFPLRGSLYTLEALAGELTPDLKASLLARVDEFRDLAEGEDSILAVRARELDITARAEALLAENADLSRELTTALDRLVGASNADIGDASREALSVQRLGSGILIGVVVLSMLCSALIVWLYVGRNLIARLTALSQSMLAIANGNLQASLPAAGADEIGQMAKALTVFRDTAIEVKETNLREISEARRRLTDAIESVSEGFALYDADDRLVLCNSRYRDLLYPGIEDVVAPGTSFESIIRRAASHGLISDADGRVDAWLAERMARHRNPSGPHLQRRGDGQWVQISERKTQDGGIVTVYTDISELKQREAELEQRELELAEKSTALETTLENMGQGISMLDADLKLTVMNRKFFEILDIPANRFRPGDKFEQLVRYNAERGEYGDVDIDQEVRNQVEIAKRFQSHTVERPRPDGTVIEVRWEPVRSGGLVLIYTDVTERKRTQEGLRRAKEQADAANRAKSQFLANMSHELRTPLNAIIGYTELIEDNIYGQVPEKIAEVIDRVGQSGRHLLGLINDVLDLSKIEAGQLNLTLDDYAMDNVVHTVVNNVESLAAEKDLRLTASVPDGLPVARGDEQRIAQALLNLLGNAIKFTDAGEVKLEVRAENGAFLVSVSDTGLGISEADQARIFDEFQQADGSDTRMKGGTGLGLAITRRMIEMHGGRIWVESTLGEGSTFWLSFPVRVEAQVEAA